MICKVKQHKHLRSQQKQFAKPLQIHTKKKQQKNSAISSNSSVKLATCANFITLDLNYRGVVFQLTPEVKAELRLLRQNPKTFTSYANTLNKVNNIGFYSLHSTLHVQQRAFWDLSLVLHIENVFKRDIFL